MDERFQEMGNIIYSELSGRGHKVIMYDEKGNQTVDPSQANRLWSDSEKIMVTLSHTPGMSHKPLCTFYISSVTDKDKFLQMREVIKKNNPYDFSFDIQPFDKILEPRHFKHMNIRESSAWTGTTRSSYYPVDNVHVVVRHTKPWQSDVLDQAQRWRRIKQIFLFTPDGERYKFPFKHLAGARAMAQHINQNCHMYDDNGKLIQNLVRLLFDLKSIQMRCRRAQQMDLMNSVMETRRQIKKLLGNMSESNNYHQSLNAAKNYVGTWARNRAQIQESLDRADSTPEMRRLMEWFDGFDTRRILEAEHQHQADEEKLEQVSVAWQATNHNIEKTLDYLKNNYPGWLSKFEQDPDAVVQELESLVDRVKNNH